MAGNGMTVSEAEEGGQSTRLRRNKKEWRERVGEMKTKKKMKRTSNETNASVRTIT